jgi:hypothetical protein
VSYGARYIVVSWSTSPSRMRSSHPTRPRTFLLIDASTKKYTLETVDTPRTEISTSMPERFKAAVRRPEALKCCGRRVQTEGFCQLVSKDAERCASINACCQTHAVFAGLQYDRNGDAFPLTAVGMNGSELDLVHSYQPPNGRSSSGTLAKKGCETPAAFAAAFTAASFGPCATSRLPSSATHSPV